MKACERTSAYLISKKISQALLAAMVLLFSVPAYANTPRIGIITFWAPGVSTSDKVNFIKQSAREFKTATKTIVVQDENLVSTLQKKADDENSKVNELNQAKRLLKEGRKLLIALKFRDARDRLKEARDLFIRNLHQISDNTDLLQTHINLGATYFFMDKQEDAKAEFKKSVLLDKELELSNKKYKPELISIFEKAKSEILELPKGALLIESIPSQADIFINGKKVGQTPQSIDLTIGKQFIRISKQGYADWFKLQLINKSFQKIRRTLRQSLSQEEEADLYRIVSTNNRPDLSLVNSLSQEAVAMQTDVILLGEIVVEEDGKATARCQWFDARTQEFSFVETLTANNGVENLMSRLPLLVKNLLTLIDRNGYVIPDQSLSLDVKQPDAKKKRQQQAGLLDDSNDPRLALLKKRQQKKAGKVWYQKWWVWAVVGGVAAGATTAVLLADGGSSKLLLDNRGNVP